MTEGVKVFLNRLGMSKYYDMFIAKGYDLESDLPYISAHELENVLMVACQRDRTVILAMAQAYRPSPEHAVYEWLRGNSLDYYFISFVQSELADLHKIAQLQLPDEEIYDELEIVLPGHRKRLERAVEKLRSDQARDAKAETPVTYGWWGKPKCLPQAKFDFLCVRASLFSAREPHNRAAVDFMIDSGSDVSTVQESTLEGLNLELIGPVYSCGVHGGNHTNLYKAHLAVGGHQMEIEVMGSNYDSLGSRVVRHFRHVIDGHRHIWLPGNYKDPLPAIMPMQMPLLVTGNQTSNGAALQKALPEATGEGTEKTASAVPSGNQELDSPPDTAALNQNTLLDATSATSSEVENGEAAERGSRPDKNSPEVNQGNAGPSEQVFPKRKRGFENHTCSAQANSNNVNLSGAGTIVTVQSNNTSSQGDQNKTAAGLHPSSPHQQQRSDSTVIHPSIYSELGPQIARPGPSTNQNGHGTVEVSSQNGACQEHQNLFSASMKKSDRLHLNSPHDPNKSVAARTNQRVSLSHMIPASLRDTDDDVDYHHHSHSAQTCKSSGPSSVSVFDTNNKSHNYHPYYAARQSHLKNYINSTNVRQCVNDINCTKVRQCIAPSIPISDDDNPNLSLASGTTVYDSNFVQASSEAMLLSLDDLDTPDQLTGSVDEIEMQTSSYHDQGLHILCEARPDNPDVFYNGDLFYSPKKRLKHDNG